MKICQHGAKIFNKTCSFEGSIGLLPSFLLSHQKNVCNRSLVNNHQLMKICQHGAGIFNKMCSFQVSIGLSW